MIFALLKFLVVNMVNVYAIYLPFAYSFWASLILQFFY